MWLFTYVLSDLTSIRRSVTLCASSWFITAISIVWLWNPSCWSFFFLHHPFVHQKFIFSKYSVSPPTLPLPRRFCLGFVCAYISRLASHMKKNEGTLTGAWRLCHYRNCIERAPGVVRPRTYTYVYVCRDTHERLSRWQEIGIFVRLHCEANILCIANFSCFCLFRCASRGESLDFSYITILPHNEKSKSDWIGFMRARSWWLMHWQHFRELKWLTNEARPR